MKASRHRTGVALVALAGALFSTLALAQAPLEPAPREVPARSLPTPATVSPELQAIIARPLNPAFSNVPKSTEEWKARVEAVRVNVMSSLPKLRDSLGVSSEAATMGGVKVFVLTPKTIAPRNRNRVLLHLHGGVRVFHPGEAGTREAVIMSGLTGYKIVSVDYRMPPDFPFPAALDDAVAVYRELVKAVDPRNIAIFGASAGGSLTLTTVLRARMENLPMPGAIAPGSPTVDLTGTGDTLSTNEFVDNVLGTQKGFIAASATLYAAGRDLKDPLISPVYGDVSGFPPALLTSGTRDLYLSHTVRMHRKLRAAGVEAILQVWEGQSHVQYMSDPAIPEVREYHEEVARFFDSHLGM